MLTAQQRGKEGGAGATGGRTRVKERAKLAAVNQPKRTKGMFVKAFSFFRAAFSQ